MQPSFAQGFARNASESANPDLWEGLVGAWIPSFGATGNTLYDISGHGNHGILTNMDAGTDWVIDKFGYALDFDGVDDYVDTNNNNDLAEWTASAWVRSPVAPSSQPANGIVHKGKNYALVWDHTNVTFRNAAVSRVGGTWYAASFGTLLSDVWYFLTGTYDGENLRAYTNSILISDNSSPSGSSDSQVNPVVIGKHAASANYFNGSIGTVCIYNRALTSQEITQLFTNSNAPFELAPQSSSLLSLSSQPILGIKNVDYKNIDYRAINYRNIDYKLLSN